MRPERAHSRWTTRRPTRVAMYLAAYAALLGLSRIAPVWLVVLLPILVLAVLTTLSTRGALEKAEPVREVGHEERFIDGLIFMALKAIALVAAALLTWYLL